MKLKDLALLFNDAAHQGVSNVMAENGQLPSQLSKAAAYRLYGRSIVERWISEGLISLSAAPGKSSLKYLDREKLEAIAATSNRMTYLPSAER